MVTKISMWARIAMSTYYWMTAFGYGLAAFIQLSCVPFLTPHIHPLGRLQRLVRIVALLPLAELLVVFLWHTPQHSIHV